MRVTVDSVYEDKDGEGGANAWVGWQVFMKCFCKRSKGE